jgi:hypothetical protein
MLVSTHNFKSNEIHSFEKIITKSSDTENKEIIKYLDEVNIKDSNELKSIISEIIIKRTKLYKKIN